MALNLHRSHLALSDPPSRIPRHSPHRPASIFVHVPLSLPAKGFVPARRCRRFPVSASPRRFTDHAQEVVVVTEPRTWGDFGEEAYGGGGDEEDDDGEEEEDDRSLDLLVRFAHNVFRRVSRRARRAVRSVLPPFISTQLVGFSVNGVMILASLWILKAFLEVACTLGSIIFVSILLVRGIWSGVFYIQERENRRNGFGGVWAAT